MDDDHRTAGCRADPRPEGTSIVDGERMGAAACDSDHAAPAQSLDDGRPVEGTQRGGEAELPVDVLHVEGGKWRGRREACERESNIPSHANVGVLLHVLLNWPSDDFANALSFERTWPHARSSPPAVSAAEWQQPHASRTTSPRAVRAAFRTGSASLLVWPRPSSPCAL